MAQWGINFGGSRIVTDQVEDNPTITVPGGHGQEDFLGLMELEIFWYDLRLERHHVRCSMIGGKAVAGMDCNIKERLRDATIE